MLGPFFPLDVLDGIWDLIESVSEGFLTYSSMWEEFVSSYALRMCEEFVVHMSYTY